MLLVAWAWPLLVARIEEGKEAKWWGDRPGPTAAWDLVGARRCESDILRDDEDQCQHPLQPFRQFVAIAGGRLFSPDHFVGLFYLARRKKGWSPFSQPRQRLHTQQLGKWERERERRDKTTRWWRACGGRDAGGNSVVVLLSALFLRSTIWEPPVLEDEGLPKRTTRKKIWGFDLSQLLGVQPSNDPEKRRTALTLGPSSMSRIVA
ncbi:hypothetical protein B0H10DRAFT_1955376 [Mycena sp. CBHHK59/15]|nr:hypothetical protein B0H10DRAFT_1955376 [Mycena sp. CBHHK59/15]